MKKSSMAIAALLTVLSTTQLVSVAYANDANTAPAAAGTDNSTPATGDANDAPAPATNSNDGDDTGS